LPMDVVASPPIRRRGYERKRSSNLQFLAPVTNGGQQLTFVQGTFPAGLGEPINMIISGTSDSRVLKNQMENGGLLNYLQSVGFDGECLGQHLGGDQQADLGDGNGIVNQTSVLRWNYGDPQLGTCKETFDGGNHLRYWIQNGPKANTGAIFMAVSYEQPASDGHDIVFNGYNLGRDEFIGNATAMSSAPPTDTYALLPPPSINSSSTTNTTLTNATLSSTTTSIAATSSSSYLESFTYSPFGGSNPTAPLETLAASLSDSSSPQINIPASLPSFVGETMSGNFTYKTTAVYLTGLLSNTSEGVNHNSTVGDSSAGVNAIDGLVALLQVEIVKAPKGSSAAVTTSPSRNGVAFILLLTVLLQILF